MSGFSIQNCSHLQLSYHLIMIILAISVAVKSFHPEAIFLSKCPISLKALFNQGNKLGGYDSHFQPDLNICEDLPCKALQVSQSMPTAPCEEFLCPTIQSPLAAWMLPAELLIDPLVIAPEGLLKDGLHEVPFELKQPVDYLSESCLTGCKTEPKYDMYFLLQSGLSLLLFSGLSRNIERDRAFFNPSNFATTFERYSTAAATGVTE